MDGIFSKLLYACGEIWRSLGLAQRASLILIAVATVGAVVLVFVLSTRPDWTILYADLEPEVAARVHDLARDREVPVRLRDSGRTILVPSRYVNELRLDAVREGIEVGKGSGDGWQLFDNTRLGMTEEQQRIALQRAIQGELAQMIGSWPGVSHARVMLAVPKKSAFLRSAEPPQASAAVLVVLRPGQALTGGQVQGIRHLVASGVEGMNPEDVTITDNHGKLLARREDDAVPGSNGNSQLEVKERLEQLLKLKAESILAPIVGPGGVVAVVNVELDFDRVSRMTEKFDANNAVPLTEKVVSEQNASQAQTAGGVVGSAANRTTVDVNDPAGSQQPEETQTESRKQSETTYAVPKTTEQVHEQGGRIRSLSVAVTVAADPEKPRPAAALEQLRRLVISATGALVNAPPGSERHDTVEVVESTFIETPIAEDSLPVDNVMVGWLRQLDRAALLRTVLGAFGLFVLYRLFVRHFGSDRVDRAELDPGVLYGENVGALPRGDGDRQLAPGETASPEERVRALSRETPAEVASAMEVWLKRELKGS